MRLMFVHTTVNICALIRDMATRNVVTSFSLVVRVSIYKHIQPVFGQTQPMMISVHQESFPWQSEMPPARILTSSSVIRSIYESLQEALLIH